MDASVPVLFRHAGDAMVAMLRHSPGFEAQLRRETWMVLSGEPHLLGNWLALVEPGAVAEAAFRSFVAELRARGHAGLVYFPRSVAGRYDALAEELGLDVPGPVPLMVCRASDLTVGPALEDAELVLVSDEDALQDATRVIAAAFDIPEDVAVRLYGAGILTEPAIRIYGIRRGGQLVSAVITHWAGARVFIDVMVTHPTHQSQGVGRALLGQVMADGARQGATLFHLMSSVEGKRLYERLSFRTVDEGVTRMVPAP